jgi:TolB-like protein/AraC-like DNA-binding protein
MTIHPEQEQNFIRNLTEIILANLGNESFGVNELVRESGMSRYRLFRKLQSVNNKTIQQFIRETRLRKALEILQNEDLTAAEVAYKTGFGSPTYFNTCFHEFFGYPPGKVKKGGINDLSGQNNLQTKPVLKNELLPRQLIINVSAVILSLGALAILIYNLSFKNPSGNSENTGLKTEKSIAVLPFKNLSDSIANQYFLEGIMEEILTNLSRILDLRVVSRTTVEKYRNIAMTSAEIAKNLDVDYIVEGSGQKYGNRFRLRVQLIEASSDNHLWAESYEQEILGTEDIFKIQSKVAQNIASALNTTITSEDKKLIKKRSTTSLSAYDFYQRGRYELVKVGLYGAGMETLARAEYLLRKALEYDSTYAQAYSALSNTYWSRFYFALNNPDIDINLCNKYLDSILIMADLALSFDHRLLDALNARGFYFSIRGSADQALEEWDKAIRYNPDDFLAYTYSASIYFFLDLLKCIEYHHEAAAHNNGSELPASIRAIAYKYFEAGFPDQGNFYLLEALKLDGDSIKHSDSKNMLGRDKNTPIEEAIIYIEKRCHANPNNLYYFGLGYYNSLLGLHKESLHYYKKINAVNFANYYPHYNNPFRTWLGFAYQVNGYSIEAESCLSNHIDICTKKLPLIQYWSRPLALYSLAGAYLCKGNKQEAYKYLRLLSQYPSYGSEFVYWLKNDPVFSVIRNEPEFREILKDVETKYMVQHEKVRKWLEGQGKM